MLLTKQHLVNTVDERWETEGEYDLRIFYQVGLESFGFGLSFGLCVIQIQTV